MESGCHPGSRSDHSLEIADIFRRHSQLFRQTHRLSVQQHRVINAIEQCRTAAMGGHIEVCDQCGALTRHYHSCRNRHCPKCQSLTKTRWVEARQAELLAVKEYFHVVFTLPHALNPLAQGNPRFIYHLLFQSAAATLQAFARNPRWLGGEPGCTMVLHTWSQNLGQHIHVHCIVPGGALGPDGAWISAKKGFLFPVRALSRVFRGKYLEGLTGAFKRGDVKLAGSTAQLALAEHLAVFINQLYSDNWVVYAKPPFAGPKQVLSYLGRYTHRIAISNHRLVSLNNDKVRFRYRDYRRGNRNKIMTLSAGEFIRRFLLHILPQGFMRIRHFGFLANRCRRDKLAMCRAALKQETPQKPPTESVAELMLRLTGVDLLLCQHCHLGRLQVIATLLPCRTVIPDATGPPT